MTRNDYLTTHFTLLGVVSLLFITAPGSQWSLEQSYKIVPLRFLRKGFTSIIALMYVCIPSLYNSLPFSSAPTYSSKLHDKLCRQAWHANVQEVTMSQI